MVRLTIFPGVIVLHACKTTVSPCRHIYLFISVFLCIWPILLCHLQPGFLEAFFPEVTQSSSSKGKELISFPTKVLPYMLCLASAWCKIIKAQT